VRDDAAAAKEVSDALKLKELGYDPTAILAPVTQEFNDRLNSTEYLIDKNFVKQAGADIHVLLNSDQRTLSALVARYDKNPALYESEKNSSLGKLVGVVSIDIGRGNIQVYKAVQLIRLYEQKFKDSDPLKLKGYLAEPNKIETIINIGGLTYLINSLLDNSNPLTVKLSAISALEARDWYIENVGLDAWNNLPQVDKNAYATTFYRIGKEKYASYKSESKDPAWKPNLPLYPIAREYYNNANYILSAYNEGLLDKGIITSTFQIKVNNTTYLIGGALQNSGNTISDGVNPVVNGIVQSGGGWSITTDASLLNNNQYINGALDNTSTTAWTQILGDGIRPGDMNTSSFVIDQKLLNQYNQYSFNPSAFDLKASSFNLLDRRAQLATPTDPLILDLNADGVKLTDWLSDPVLFDADNDGGSKEQTGWVDKNDGIVVYDLNNNAVIDNISETLSEYFNGTKGTGGNAGTKPFKDGFAALKSLDSNNDNQFTSADTAWNSVKVWVDNNHDGKSWNDLNNNGILDGTEATELKTFAQLGITAINLKTTQQSGLINGGNEVLSTSTFIQNGLTRDAQAANFLTNPNGQTQTQSGAGVLVTFEDSNNIPTSKSYLSQSTTGEVIDLATKGVINATGGTGNDTLNGTSENNWLAGSQGSDTFNAGAGDDVLLIDAEDLATNIHGGDGMDIVQVVGDAGVTLNLAQAEIEIAQGGRGNDIFVGNGGKSVFMRGGDGNDVLIGGAANDALNGEDGSDYISGSLGNDVLRGGRGQDALFGDAGDDLLFGGQDDDALNGSGGNDVLRGDQGDDILDGGDGIDVAELTGLYSDYRITKLTDTTWRVVDTRGGRDGADTLVNVEKLNFADVSSVDITLPNPLPVKDVVTVANRTGSTINYNGTTYNNVFLISGSQLTLNDQDWQGDVISLRLLVDKNGNDVAANVWGMVQGGQAMLTTQGDVLFRPDPAYTGIMGFQYKVKDSQNNLGAQAVLTTTGQSTEMKANVWLKSPDLPSDPLVTDQWYLSQENILAVWKNYTGKGVRIGQFEPGSAFAVDKQILDYRHPDLQPNIDQNWLANPTIGNIAGEGSADHFSTHATLVAGVIVAAKNGEGAVGVAYDAKIGGHWISNDGSDLNALRKMAWYDIANNSWVATPSFVANFNNNPDLQNAFEYSVANGRSGLGTIIVMAGGNDRASGGNANYLSTSNNRFSIAAGAINAQSDLGTLQVAQSPFSNPGSNILVSASGSNVTSTARLIETENGSVFGSDYSVAQGTSFATPIISGIVALMLEANPNLGYRDIQEILAISARKITDTNTQWQENHTDNWNGGSMHISHDYGFGEVDARAAVRLAETWNKQQTYANEVKLISPISSGTLNAAIPDNNETGISKTLTVSNAPLKVEHAEITVNLTHARAGDLIIKLISPTGTESILMNRPGKAPNSAVSDRGDITFSGSNALSFTFTTVRDWGEVANGAWTLQVIDAATGDTGTLQSWSLNLYGKADNGSDTYFYTDEIAAVAPARRTLAADTDGGEDTINAAAASGNSIINLTTGSATIAGVAVTLTTPANLEISIGGESNDLLTGNAANNRLIGGRGDDTLAGAAGYDVLFGGLGNNTLTGGTQDDAFVIEKKANAVDTITDFQVNIDRIILSGFSGNAYSSISFVQEGANVRANLGDGQFLLVQNVTVAQMNPGQFLSIKDGLSPRDLTGYTDYSFGADTFTQESSWTTNSTVYWGGDNIGTTGASEGIFGGTGSDRIYGGAGNDTLVGENASSSQTGGNDVLFGEDGIDVIYGGGGDDVLWGGGDIDFLDGGYGNDVLNCEGDEGLGGYSGFSLSGGSQFINGTLIGNITINNAQLNGAAVQGGVGNDRFVVVEHLTSTASQGFLNNLINDFEVGNANEKIDLSKVRSVSSFGELTFNTVTALVGSITQSFLRVWLGTAQVGTQYITLKNVTQGQLTADKFLFYDGFSLPPLVKNAVLNGTAGNDILNGDAGGNQLLGSAGADILSGRTGDDVYEVDNTGDQVIELPDGGFDTVIASVNYILPTEVENLTLTGTTATNATGNSKANRLVGNSLSNILDGMAGSDMLIGGLGNDTYIVDIGTDTVIEQLGEGYDGIQTSVSFTLPKNVESLLLTGIDAINGTGNELDNVVEGNAEDNVLNGAQGADSIYGKAGNDILIGGSGNDTLDGGDGEDTVYLNGTVQQFSTVFNQGFVKVGSTQNNNDTDTLTNIEYLQFSDGLKIRIKATPNFEIANSQTEFSGVQGQNNWYYGYYITSFTSANYQPMTQFVDNVWKVNNGTYWTLISDYGGHPNGVIGGITPVEQWAVRRWVSEVDGEIQIYGILAKGDTQGGNGVIGHIFVDGVEVWSQSIAGTDGTGINYQITTKVKLNSVVDFAIDPKDSYDGADTTIFKAKIDALNQTPTNLTLSNSNVAENQAIGKLIGNLNTTDPDSGNTFTYSLVTGTGSTVSVHRGTW